MKPSILVVDDESDNIDSLERLFRKKYQVFKALSGPQALDIVKDQRLALIISDQRMPEMDGVSFFKESMKHQPESIRILLTGYTDIESVVDAINSGEVYRYITKPWDPVDLANTVDKAVEKYQLRSELEIKNRELQAALEELQTLDEAKNHFMVLINHELKTPLTVILSFMHLLKESRLNSEQQVFVKRIDQSTTRLKKIIDDVLELVRAETGLLKIQKKKLSLLNVLKDIPEEILVQAKAKDQEFLVELEDLKVQADPHILKSVLRRVIENAVKFGTKGTQIQLRAITTEEGPIEVSVTNKGKAMSPKMIEKIMKPFALDENILNHSEGMGLGLSLCQALLKNIESGLQIECLKGWVKVSFLI